MVIISTSATEVSIQAVSPELGVQFSSTANFGSALPAQAGGDADASAAGAVVASSAEEPVIADMGRNKVKRRPIARAMSPARVGFLNVIGSNSCRQALSAGFKGLRGRSPRGGCARQYRGRGRSFPRPRSDGSWRLR